MYLSFICMNLKGISPWDGHFVEFKCIEIALPQFIECFQKTILNLKTVFLLYKKYIHIYNPRDNKIYIVYITINII